MSSTDSVTIELPAAVFAELQQIGERRRTTPEELIAEMVRAERQHLAWLDDLNKLREMIASDPQHHKVLSDEEATANTRTARQAIFEAEYAHLYR
jgi:predicted transcriptional regulator